MTFDKTFVDFIHKTIMLSGTSTPIKEMVVSRELYARIRDEIAYIAAPFHGTWTVGINYIKILGVTIIPAEAEYNE